MGNYLIYGQGFNDRTKPSKQCEQAEKYKLDLDVRVYQVLLNFDLEERISWLS